MIYLIQKYWLQLTIIQIVCISTLSLWPAVQLPSVPGSDKTHHFLAYAALIFPTVLTKPKYYFSIIIGFIIFSGAIEVIQPYVNRYGEWLDMLANTLGLFCGWILAKSILFLFHNK
jgi:VanZ family protein